MDVHLLLLPLMLNANGENHVDLAVVLVLGVVLVWKPRSLCSKKNSNNLTCLNTRERSLLPVSLGSKKNFKQNKLLVMMLITGCHILMETTLLTVDTITDLMLMVLIMLITKLLLTVTVVVFAESKLNF